MNSQLPRIIAILEKEGRISNFYAVENKLTLRLAARIADLKAKGYEFRTEMQGKNCVYVLTKVPEPAQLTLS
jgi:hypothetical protein